MSSARFSCLGPASADPGCFCQLGTREERALLWVREEYQYQGMPHSKAECRQKLLLGRPCEWNILKFSSMQKGWVNTELWKCSPLVRQQPKPLLPRYGRMHMESSSWDPARARARGLLGDTGGGGGLSWPSWGFGRPTHPPDHKIFLQGKNEIIEEARKWSPIFGAQTLLWPQTPLFPRHSIERPLNNPLARAKGRTRVRYQAWARTRAGIATPGCRCGDASVSCQVLCWAVPLPLYPYSPPLR